MKHTLYILLLIIASHLYAQTLTPKDIATYVKTIDSLRQHKALKVIHMGNMSACAGALTGYYYQNTLVYITGKYAAELGYTEQKLYLRDTIPYKLYYRQYFAEWEKYYLKYPNKELDLDEKKMTYSDTLYTVLFTKPIKVAKTSNHKYINQHIQKDLLHYICGCITPMFLELEKERKSR
ncbi:MAG: hypothetical protein V4580_17535 [Bacteroidota bacterium]